MTASSSKPADGIRSLPTTDPELLDARERIAELEALLGDNAGTPDAHAAALRGVLNAWAQPPEAMLARLPRGRTKAAKDTPGRCDANAVKAGKSDYACGGWHALPAIHLDYMGHADVTEALIKVDPFWNWRPAAVNPNTGGPLIHTGNGAMARMWGYLTVLGVERLCVGTCEGSKFELEKELIGDLLRNGALRFGIAVRLWSKADHEDAAEPVDDPAADPARQQRADRARADIAQQAATPPQEAATAVPGTPDTNGAGEPPPPARSSSDAPPRKARAMPAEAGPGAIELGHLADTGPKKARAVRFARDATNGTDTPAPASFEEILAGPDWLAADVAEQLANHGAKK